MCGNRIACIAVLCFVPTAGKAAMFFQASEGVVAFSKEAFTNVNDAANWDIISPSVAITRGNAGNIYNPLVETSTAAGSPSGTLWKFNNTVQDVIDGVIDLSDFRNIGVARPGQAPSVVGRDAVLYLVAEEAFLDITFTEWGRGSGGGGGGGGSFSYERAVFAPVPEPAGAVMAMVISLASTARGRGRYRKMRR